MTAAGSSDAFSKTAQLRVVLADVHAMRHSGTPESLLPLLSNIGDLVTPETPEQCFKDALECLVSLVRQDTSVILINHALSILGRIKALEAVPVLIDVLLATDIALYDQSDAGFLNSDDSLRVRSTAAQALGKLRDERAIIPLMSILNDKDMNYRLRLAAAEALGKIGHDHAVNPLIDILKDEREKSLYLKESAVKALGMLGDIRAIEPLIDVFESKRGIRDKFNFLKEQVIEAIARIGQPSPKATDTLLYALKDSAPSIRLAAVEALSEIGEDDCLPMLTQMVKDTDDDVAIAAIAAIYHLGGESAIENLLQQENLPQFLRDELESYIP